MVWRQRPVEFWVAVVTTLTVVLVGVEEGIVLAIAVSIVAHIRHSYHPYDRLLVRFEGKVWKNLPLDSGVQARQGLLIYRFGASLYYANASRFGEEVDCWSATPRSRCAGSASPWSRSSTSTSPPPLCSSSRSAPAGARDHVVLCDVADPVRVELRRDGAARR